MKPIDPLPASTLNQLWYDWDEREVLLRQIITEISTGIGQGIMSKARIILLPGRSSNIKVAIRPTPKLMKTDKNVNATFQTKILLNGSRKPLLPRKSVKCRPPIK